MATKKAVANPNPPHKAYPNLRPNQKGQERRGGNTKGVPIKQTQILKDALLIAGGMLGRNNDGKAKDDLIGFLVWVGINEPKTFCTMLGRVIPTQINHTSRKTSVTMIMDNMSDEQAAKIYHESIMMGAGAQLIEGHVEETEED